MTDSLNCFGYCLFLAPSRIFEIGLKMFDINSDGSVEFSEFDKVLCELITIVARISCTSSCIIIIV